MKYVFISVSDNVIRKVSFHNEASQAIQSLLEYAKVMDPEKEDAAVYGPEGLISSAMDLFHDESLNNPVYIIANPYHSLGFLVMSPNEPVGYFNPSQAVCDLERIRREQGNLPKIYKVREINWPIIQKREIENHVIGRALDKFNFTLVQEYLL